MPVFKVWSSIRNPGADGISRAWRWATMTPLIITLALVALAATPAGKADAAQLPPGPAETWPAYEDGGGGPIHGVNVSNPVLNAAAFPVAAGSKSGEWPANEWTYPPDDECWLNVWSGRMTAGVGSDSGTDIKGYHPGLSPVIGQLILDTFEYGGEKYVVEGLYQQSTRRGGLQLVLAVNRPLPEHLILSVGANRFFIFDASTMGDNDNVYLWSLDKDLGWSEGDIRYATLAEAQYQESGT